MLSYSELRQIMKNFDLMFTNSLTFHPLNLNFEHCGYFFRKILAPAPNPVGLAVIYLHRGCGRQE